ncbi:MAG: hypothetical protein K6A89_01320 [Treponema sp.]|nr:hypothetical protein [Treponema sp.]
MKKILCLISALCLSLPIFAAYNRLGIPDSSEVRVNLEERWFTAPLSMVRENQPEIHTNDNGEKFQVRLEESDTTFNIFVAPRALIKVNVFSDKGMYTEEQELYPGDAAGSWVLIRDKRNGKALRIRYYFLKNSEVFIQFTPQGKIALADLVIFGNYAARGVPTGMPFEKFYAASFEDVMTITETKLPWNYVLIDPEMYHSMKQMSAVIREKLPSITLVQDAMYDENNELVHISTGKKFEKAEKSDISEQNLLLSSAGFVKWIADGLVEPMSGGILMREPLIKETVSVKDNGKQGVLSQKYDLFFSLNWVRNLASAVISVYSGKTYMFNQSGADVTVNPFASSITDRGVANTVTFVENSGYTVAVLNSLLYVLAATEPGTLYFGAIRGTDRTVSPEIMAFNECVAFFPYFQDDGGFACNVFMNGREMTLENFCYYYAEDFVYLTRVKSSEQFFPK